MQLYPLVDDMKKSITLIYLCAFLGLGLLNGITDPIHPYRSTVVEGFEAEGIPPFWTVADEDSNGLCWRTFDASVSSVGNHSGNKVIKSTFNYSGNSDWLITPRLNPTTEYSSISFWATSTNEYQLESMEILVSVEGNSPEEFQTVLQTVEEVPHNWTQYEFDLADYLDAEEIYVAIVCTSVNKLALYLDDFTFPKYDYTTELGIISFTGDQLPTVGEVSQYEVKLRNFGSETLTGYRVSIRDEANQELSGYTDDEIEPNQTKVIPLEFSADFFGQTRISASIDPADDFPLNNSKDLEIYVQTENSVAQTVGETDSSGNTFPASYFWKYSLTQTIYTQDEIPTGNLITGISYYNNFISDIEDVNMAEAITRVNNDQIALDVSYKLTSELSRMSLLNFI